MRILTHLQLIILKKINRIIKILFLSEKLQNKAKQDLAKYSKLMLYSQSNYEIRKPKKTLKKFIN